MELTIIQNGALFAMQHRTAKRSHGQHGKRHFENANKTISNLRTSVGELVFGQIRVGCYLGNVRGVLGLRGTNQAALRTWDAVKPKTAANQIGTRSRWYKSKQKL